jgi:hypothetical protein
VVAPIRAQEARLGPATDPFHYAFANYLGSGIYTVEGRTAQVYRFPFNFRILSEEKRGWGLRVRIPITFGFYDFKLEDILITGIPDRVATLSVVPSIRFPVRIGERWAVTPFGDFGAAKDFEGGQTTWVYGAGAVADALYPVAGADMHVALRFLWAGHSAPDVVLADDFVRIDSGVDYRIPMWFRIRGEQANFGVFVKNYYFLKELEILQIVGGPFELTSQWEVGVTFGTRTPWKFLGIKMPRIGLSTRFGENITAIRLVFGNPLPR